MICEYSNTWVIKLSEFNSWDETGAEVSTMAEDLWRMITNVLYSCWHGST